MIQRIKDYLVALGSNNFIVRIAVKIYARKKRFVVTFENETISMTQKNRRMTLPRKDLYLVPISMECFDQFFEDVEPSHTNGFELLDFSEPASYRYKRHGITLSFPGAPEDDSIAAYTSWHIPQPGELVFDVGAHAGFTTCMFAQLVGHTGRVIAFEPDVTSFKYLERNVLELGLSNVTLVPKAMDARTGTAYFNADGTMGAGLIEHSVYQDTGQRIAVQTISLHDACAEFGIPEFLKMDIEGAEIAVIEAERDFLRDHPIHMAFDSYHRMRDGRYTWVLLDKILESAGYTVKSSSQFGQMFTWARPVRTGSSPATPAG